MGGRAAPRPGGSGRERRPQGRPGQRPPGRDQRRPPPPSRPARARARRGRSGRWRRCSRPSRSRGGRPDPEPPHAAGAGPGCARRHREAPGRRGRGGCPPGRWVRPGHAPGRPDQHTARSAPGRSAHAHQGCCRPSAGAGRREALPSLEAARLEHVPAARRRHPGAEPVSSCGGTPSWVDTFALSELSCRETFTNRARGRHGAPRPDGVVTPVYSFHSPIPVAPGRGALPAPASAPRRPPVGASPPPHRATGPRLPSGSSPGCRAPPPLLD